MLENITLNHLLSIGSNDQCTKQCGERSLIFWWPELIKEPISGCGLLYHLLISWPGTQEKLFSRSSARRGCASPIKAVGNLQAGAHGSVCWDIGRRLRCKPGFAVCAKEEL